MAKLRFYKSFSSARRWKEIFLYRGYFVHNENLCIWNSGIWIKFSAQTLAFRELGKTISGSFYFSKLVELVQIYKYWIKRQYFHFHSWQKNSNLRKREKFCRRSLFDKRQNAKLMFVFEELCGLALLCIIFTPILFSVYSATVNQRHISLAYMYIHTYIYIYLSLRTVNVFFNHRV